MDLCDVNKVLLEIVMSIYLPVFAALGQLSKLLSPEVCRLTVQTTQYTYSQERLFNLRLDPLLLVYYMIIIIIKRMNKL